MNRHLLSVDFESWIFSKRINEKKLSIKELRELDNGYSKKSLNYLLKLLKKHNQKITFFVVGKLEEIYPGIIKEILDAGHEVGWHTYSHQDIVNIKILKEELEKSEKIIKKYHIRGFQAPTITFFREGYKILKDAGFDYSSSIYGNSSKPLKFSDIWEIPVSTSNRNYSPKSNQIVFPSNMRLKLIKDYGIPYGSSFFWSILGKRYYLNKLREGNSRGDTVNMFIHEWQIVTPQSPVYKKDVSFSWNPIFFPYKINVSSIFESLIREFKFQTFREYINSIE